MSTDFSSVTELAGNRAHGEQLSMIHTRYRLAYDLCDGKDVLEVACGPGRALGYLATRARSVVGGDRTSALVAAANSYYAGRVKVVELDAQDMPFSDRSYDLVLLFEALYYLPNPERFLKEAHRVLRPGGTLLLCTPNPQWSEFNPSPFSVRYYSADELRDLVSRAGFSVTMKAAFPTGNHSFIGEAISVVRQTAVALHLVPKTMKGKALLKRLFYGQLAEMGPEIDTSVPYSALIDIPKGDVTGYKVLYVVARRQD